MAKSIFPTKQELFNQTPFFVTILGYLFSFAILLGAASTFLIRSDLYSKGTVTLHPTIERVSLDTDSVVVGVSVATGKVVSDGDPILSVLEDPQSVALSRLRKSLRENMAVLENGDEGFRDTAKQLESEIPDPPIPTVLHSPIDGILIQLQSPNPDRMEDILFVPPKEPLFMVASVDRILLEIDIPLEQIPSVQVGDTLSIHIPAWRNEPIDTQVSSIDTKPITSIDKEFIPADVIEEIGENLNEGLTDLPGPDCWIKVGTQRLFDRLFEK
ncbi:MAG: HlyD family efflux transporter periplasmic adaptor subunit [Candidatus Omnitrophica bacterium]|nr:HlyD family efflux transporter periplasmic adaptor subunit [Candidatus Omnitrophota bacterium]